MSNIESRIERLEKQTMADKQARGQEMLIKYRDGKVTRFHKGEGPPWDTLIIEVAHEQTEDQCKRFEENMQALFNGEEPGGSHDARAEDRTPRE